MIRILLVLLLVLAACTADAPMGTAPGASSIAASASPSPSSPPATATPSPSPDVTPLSTASPSAARSDAPAAVIAGRPFDAVMILDAMRTSRRPGGVPAQLQTDAIAREIAGAIWTIDGRPWSRMAIGGSCGPASCTLHVSGGHDGAAGEDAWTFAITPASERVEVVEANLASVPAAIATRADAVARSSAVTALLEGMVVGTVTWRLPPDGGVVDLAYRDGDEEGSCHRDVRVDLGDGGVEMMGSDGC